MRTGIFGGTFNPPHIGHLLLAERVQESLSLDTVLFVPAAIPPHKVGEPSIAPNEHRVSMLLRAIQGNPQFDISTVEIDREGVSYTADTLRLLAQSYPGAELYLLIGADNLADFHTWREPEVICSLARLAVMHRAGFSADDVDPRWRKHVVAVRTPTIEISGTEIRRRIAEGKSIRYYVTPAVAEYIQEKGLYRSS